MVVIAVILLIAYETVGLAGFGVQLEPPMDEMIGMTVTRGLGGHVFLTLLWYLGYSVLNPLKKPFLRSLLFCIPAFAVVINNLHIYTLAIGVERVTSGADRVALLALECLCVGLFEEMAFRGVVFLTILEKRRRGARDIVIAILLSAAVFGAVHALNLFYMPPIAVIQQIGYSFLIGAMCSVVLVKTHNIWICVILHAIFNFGGALVPTLGEGFVWDTPTIIITVILAVATTVYMTVALIKIPAHTLDSIYALECKNSKKMD